MGGPPAGGRRLPVGRSRPAGRPLLGGGGRMGAGCGGVAPDGLRFAAIATVYVHAAGVRLPQPMLALRSTAEQPAQFVFDRGWLGGPPGLLAFVVSASDGERAAIERQVLQQARAT